MCIAIPMQLVSIDGSIGIAEVDGVSRQVNLMLIDSPVVGDYVIIHAGCAINKIDEATALETIAMVRSLLAAEGGAHDLQ